MYERTSILAIVEDAERNYPRCSCGAPMNVMERGGALWLECLERPEPATGLRGRLGNLVAAVAHDRRLLLDVDELQAA